MDVVAYPETVSAELPVNKLKTRSNPSKARQVAFDMFEQRLSIKEVAKSVNRAESTTTQYLVEYIEREKINNPYPWVNEQAFGRIINTAKEIGGDRIKPVFNFLNGEMDYNQIRISLACLRNNG